MLHSDSVRARRLVIAAIIAICIGAPIVEMFDRWDDTLQTDNDTEANVVIVALCVGLALSVTSIFVARLGGLAAGARQQSSISRPLRVPLSTLASPIPNCRPPTVLRV